MKSSAGLHEERAILLKRIGRHEQALLIYARELKDFKLAEDYCIQTWSTNKEEEQNVFLSLLKIYLQKDEPLMDPALKLINKHFKRINLPRALELFPKETPVNQLFPVLEAVMRDRNTEKRNEMVAKNLLKSENLEVRMIF